MADGGSGFRELLLLARGGTPQQLPAPVAAPSAAAPQPNPALLYLASLGSAESRRVMASRLLGVAKILRNAGFTLEWPCMDEPWLIVTRAELTGRDHTPSHINAVLSLLRGIAWNAWRHQIISTEAYLRIKTFPAVRGHREPKRRWLRPEEISGLVDDCVNDDRTQGLRDAALLAVLYGCGLRRAEVVAIDVEHLDHAEGSVRIRGKGNKERLVYPPPRAWDLLNEWLRESGKVSGPVFCRVRKGGVITPDRLTGQGVYFLINKFIARTNIARFTPHDLRGSFISFLLDTGTDIKTVKDIVGHADIQTTSGYDRRGEERKKKANRSIQL